MSPTHFCPPPYRQVSSTHSHHRIMESFVLEGTLKATWSNALTTNRDICSWIRLFRAWSWMSPCYSWIFILLALPASHPLQVLFILHLLLSQSSQIPHALMLKQPQHFSLSLSYFSIPSLSAMLLFLIHTFFQKCDDFIPSLCILKVSSHPQRKEGSRNKESSWGEQPALTAHAQGGDLSHCNLGQCHPLGWSQLFQGKVSSSRSYFPAPLAIQEWLQHKN